MVQMTLTQLLREVKRSHINPAQKIVLQIHDKADYPATSLDEVRLVQMGTEYSSHEKFLKDLLIGMANALHLRLNTPTANDINKGMDSLKIVGRLLVFINDSIFYIPSVRDIPDPELFPENYTVGIGYIPEASSTPPYINSAPLNMFRSKQEFDTWLQHHTDYYEEHYKNCYLLKVILSNWKNGRQYEYRPLSDKLEQII